MSAQDDLIADVLGDFTDLSDGPALEGFEQYVLEQIAHRPSPSADPSDAPTWAQRLEAKLDLILSQLGGGAP